LAAGTSVLTGGTVVTEISLLELPCDGWPASFAVGSARVLVPSGDLVAGPADPG